MLPNTINHDTFSKKKKLIMTRLKDKINIQQLRSHFKQKYFFYKHHTRLNL